MAINEEQRQLEIAAEVEELARTLAHSTRAVPHPIDSYRLLGELGATIDHLAQVIDQLGKWHSRTEDGTHYNGEDGDGTGSAHAAADELTTAANMLRLASSHVGRAHSHNGVVRWYQEPQES
ncbi:hypothetical protein ACWIFB_16390 [Dietzia sp. NPDC055340]|uniref:Uncharacterized protein n=1 Tax=Tessaracoccus flavus TaxID=1610493 RepID=A0A1Q2CID1_9ACTN|nr:MULTISPECIES: hypothetical protein [Actinomycetes]AQP45888.1 hypothetical protein RPIT_14620 [Tessaracoccus flavus]OBA48275.1 hypothetical protein A5728_06545 [Kocuria sp. ICS0012]SDZ06333.1 hypothetical protein SAMN05428934_10991 [Tessaracoccus flavus]